MALAVVLLGVSPASAQDRYTDEQGRFIETSHTELGDTGCSVTITLRNNSEWIYPTSVYIDGTLSYGPTVDNRAVVNGARVLGGPIQDVSLTRTLTFTDGNARSIRYVVEAGTERDLYKNQATNVPRSVGESTTFTFPALTLRERVERGCVTTAVEPEPTSTEEAVSEVDCQAEARVLRTQRTTTSSLYDADTNTWSPGPPIVTFHDEHLEPLSEDELVLENCITSGAGGDSDDDNDTSQSEASRDLPDTGAPGSGPLILGVGLIGLGGAFLVMAQAMRRQVPMHRA
ncbi:hypothetical protein [Aeromicrobium sp. A1-2]|uniref:hypothetical protein n=1 Tax=Aeromicrobium sp. A1-2 TaxID=2107713 RepID=UPI0013C2D93B|nr:hypothetical protein [Aeromicrobium sp. A1-2]